MMANDVQVFICGEEVDLDAVAAVAGRDWPSIFGALPFLIEGACLAPYISREPRLELVKE